MNGAGTIDVLCEDGPVLAVNKPAGLLTLGAMAGVPTLERQVRQYLKEKYQKPGNVYLGIPHRLDRPVSGVMVFSRNSKAAARLAEQFRERQVGKIYWALVEGLPDPAEGELVDWLLKSPDKATVEIVSPETHGAREARLRYRVLPNSEILPDSALHSGHSAFSISPLLSPPFEGGKTRRTCVEIELLTGRTHQIRVQLAARGWPVVGDFQYGAATSLGAVRQTHPRDEPIALHARSLTIRHPIRYDRLRIIAPLPATWPPSPNP